MKKIKSVLKIGLCYVLGFESTVYAVQIPQSLQDIRDTPTATTRKQWIYKSSSQGDLTFNEYLVSGEDLACGFHGLGYKPRHQAIEYLISALTDTQATQNLSQEIQQYIANSLYGEDKDLFEGLDYFLQALRLNPNNRNAQDGKDRAEYYINKQLNTKVRR